MNMMVSRVDDSRARMAARIRTALTQRDRAMDAYFYRSPLVYETELTELVFRSWLYAGHVSELPSPGDYLTVEIGEDSLIIVRDDDGGVRALMNICRHRGARVCEGASGNRKTFVCPYHGWVYRTDGSLKAAREMHMLEGFDTSAHGLKQARVVVYMGLIFINCNPQADDLLAPLQNLSRQLGAYDLANARVAHKHTYRIGANWKLVLENYLECYHCATSHRAYSRMHTLKEADHSAADQAMLARTEAVTGVAGMGARYERVFADADGFGCCVYTSRYGLYDGFLTGSKDGQPVAPLMGQIKDYDGGVGDFQIGPLTFMLNYPDHCVLYRFIPRDVGSTDMEVVWFVRGDAVEGIHYDREQLTWLWHHTTLEDEYIITRNSQGVNSRFFEPGPYHPTFESELQEFMAWYLTTLSESL